LDVFLFFFLKVFGNIKYNNINNSIMA
jgi:hypothetical protein